MSYTNLVMTFCLYFCLIFFFILHYLVTAVADAAKVIVGAACVVCAGGVRRPPHPLLRCQDLTLMMVNISFII